MEFEIIGRYANGRSITSYEIMDLNSKKSFKVTKEQLCFLVGKKQVKNCYGQLYDGKVLFRGVGVSLDKLPLLSDIHSIVEDKGKPYNIVGVIADGRSNIGYRLKDLNGNIKIISRKDVIRLAEENKIGNARVQKNNGETILRGVGVNLNELPTVKVSGEVKKKRNKSLVISELYTKSKNSKIYGGCVTVNNISKTVSINAIKKLALDGMLKDYCKEDGVTLDMEKIKKIPVKVICED